MRLNNLRIGARLGGGFAIVLALLLATLIAGSVINTRSSGHMADSLTLANSKIMQANTMRGSLLAAGIAMRNIGMLSEVSAMEKENLKVAAQQKRYDEALGQLTALGLSNEEKAIIVDVARLDNEIEVLLKEALGQAIAFNTEGAGRTITTKIDPLNQQALAQIDKLVESQQAASARILDDTLSAGKRLQYVLFIVSAIAMGLGAMCAWQITRSITQPLRGAVAIAKRVAAGDLRSHVEVTGVDEISELLRALKDMNDSLIKTVGAVRRSTETITVASREIASGNADLSARTETQAGALEETASSMEELTGTVKQNADNARQASQLVVSASDVAAKGGEVVGQVVATMGSIKESSGKIVDIISVIDGIAFQTNILALNAAVEAARAGEQGRGFAVVASEVRNLAQRSAGAAKEIKTLISDSVDKVDLGSKLVDDAGKTMEEIVASVKRVADIMGEIAAASQEQRAGIEEVDRAIGQMDGMTQQNAALVEQAAAAAESLSHQAQQLAEAVHAFNLEDSAMAQPAAPEPAQKERVTKLPVRAKAGARGLAVSASPERARALKVAGGDWEEF
ncbi:methyl-accepting chemotaxis protein [Noviherbaspirillum sp.]|uniref:methyl-accepting chemotaxis protein n=1 Tax=Noviherbaspirillum sp. TaxID=1926288 RepID=UPI002B47E30F|nr:methyl-accepting chemotaxis protein [Noviherbaspirillum sp.]HJV79859.1 methyl-accepting chemotaxis protein [Noviherbaspirillum sp.]